MTDNSRKLIPTSDAIAKLPLPKGAGDPITVIGNDAIRKTFDDVCLKQAVNARRVFTLAVRFSPPPGIADQLTPGTKGFIYLP